jgi:sulfotransferase family protein
MSWEPPPRPEWVRAVNDGLILPIAEVAEMPFTRDALLAEARATFGLVDGGIADFGSDDFLEPLDVLLPALEQEAQLTVMGRWMTRRFLLRFLEVRSQLARYVRDDPGVVDEEIREPWFVTGAPRTGTTILHALLAQDPTSRVPEGWELLRPVPPPSPDPHEFAADARIPLADRELRLPGQVAGELDAIHVYRGRMHKECLSAMSFAFRSEEFTARYHVPSYVEWYERCDMRPAYDAHRLVLQILQRRFRNVHWVLKSPVHLSALPTLFAVYPDARLAITHRDPLTVLASLTSLVATLRWAHSDRVDFADIGRYHERIHSRALDGLVTASSDGTLDSGRVHHVHYADFMQDQIGVINELYAALGRSLPQDTAQAMREYLAGRPKDKHGAHEYSFADLELDPAVERERFARYQRHFSVPEEALR